MARPQNTIFSDKVLVFDGAMGTQLAERGWELGTCLECWAVDHREAVRDVHSRYIAAGADVILSCTFGANSIRLANYNSAERTPEINMILVRAAREAVADQDILVAGDVGPTGLQVESRECEAFELARTSFSEQIEAIQVSGVDLLVIESMCHVHEVEAALEAAATFGEELPVVVSLVFDENVRTMDGCSPEQAVEKLRWFPLAGLGCNCMPPGEALRSTVSRLHEASGLPVVVQPSAGLPAMLDGGSVYPVGDREFAEAGKKLVEMGVAGIGGCCGTTPEYIMALGDTIR